MVDAQTKRLFFALYPSGTVRQAIIDSVTGNLSSSVKLVPRDNLHLTLLFMGATNVSQQSAYLAAANTIQADQFDLELNVVDQFSKAKVLWLGVQNVPENLISLHSRLSDALQSAGFDSRTQAYRPHVTLARNYRGQTPAYSDQIPWHVQSFSLMESCGTDQGVRYNELQRWPLN
jgi:2'-5' RNA ligase